MQVSSDDLEGVPEMWLEPATEPIDDSVPIEEPVTLKTPVPKKVEPVKKIKPIKEKKQKKETTPIQKNKYEDFHSIIVLESKMCQKVKNNQPINPGTQFPQDIGKVFCHSLLNNNSGKHRDIYHIWYLNGDLKAKVRIRVRSGKEIPAISHREFGNSDKGRKSDCGVKSLFACLFFWLSIFFCRSIPLVLLTLAVPGLFFDFLVVLTTRLSFLFLSM